MDDEEEAKIAEIIALANAGILRCALRDLNGCTDDDVRLYQSPPRANGRRLRMAVCQQCNDPSDGWEEIEH